MLNAQGLPKFRPGRDDPEAWLDAFKRLGHWHGWSEGRALEEARQCLGGRAADRLALDQGGYALAPVFGTWLAFSTALLVAYSPSLAPIQDLYESCTQDHDETVRSYASRFSSLAQALDLSPCDRPVICDFANGLQPALQAHLPDELPPRLCNLVDMAIELEEEPPGDGWGSAGYSSEDSDGNVCPSPCQPGYALPGYAFQGFAAQGSDARCYTTQSCAPSQIVGYSPDGYDSDGHASDGYDSDGGYGSEGAAPYGYASSDTDGCDGDDSWAGAPGYIPEGSMGAPQGAGLDAWDQDGYISNNGDWCSPSLLRPSGKGEGSGGQELDTEPHHQPFSPMRPSSSQVHVPSAPDFWPPVACCGTSSLPACVALSPAPSVTPPTFTEQELYDTMLICAEALETVLEEHLSQVAHSDDSSPCCADDGPAAAAAMDPMGSWSVWMDGIYAFEPADGQGSLMAAAQGPPAVSAAPPPPAASDGSDYMSSWGGNQADPSGPADPVEWPSSLLTIQVLADPIVMGSPLGRSSKMAPEVSDNVADSGGRSTTLADDSSRGRPKHPDRCNDGWLGFPKSDDEEGGPASSPSASPVPLKSSLAAHQVPVSSVLTLGPNTEEATGKTESADGTIDSCASRAWSGQTTVMNNSKTVKTRALGCSSAQPHTAFVVAPTASNPMAVLAYGSAASPLASPGFSFSLGFPASLDVEPSFKPTPKFSPRAATVAPRRMRQSKLTEGAASSRFEGNPSSQHLCGRGKPACALSLKYHQFKLRRKT
ncbi:hypothetical protein HYH03_005829 [Edaphochlamys debaryana]|uniref:Retrotransposon gag domain-containing protein n=1 Tax=Edaphochlamys debaryana TaxID=47281 RepID=A0A835Y583_9CHLO|nr:hypothetical protein HYH03_005829 [Edaphochlamys debaryana]|eukprot:KAG2496231.1 hypothetical protein HYH03_005829 [Edaphochlamys debaryana]